MGISTILLLEDGEAEQFLCKTIISGFDPAIDIHTCYDGQQALDFLAETNEIPDVILADVNMPGMGGIEFIQAYEEKYGAQHSPLIFLMTSVIPQEDKTQSFKCFKGYISKPLNPNDLEKITAMLD